MPPVSSLLFLVLWVVGLLLQRTFVHPLLKLRGPWLAAASGWYRTYFDVVKGGGWLDQLKVLHERYGPVVRVGPNEIHFSDPNAYNQIYGRVGSVFTKDPELYNTFNVPEASFGLLDPKKAKERRDLLTPLFSRRAVQKLESVLQAKVDQLVDQLAACPVANLTLAFRYATLDLIDEYLFARSGNLLASPQISISATDDPKGAGSLIWVHRHFPWIAALLNVLPVSIIARVNTARATIKRARNARLEELNVIMANHVPGHEPEEHDVNSFYCRLLSGKNTPSNVSLLQEGHNLHFGGSDNTATACAFAVFHVLDNPSVKRTLRAALVEVWPDVNEPVGLEVLEKVSYLTAVLKEALRFSFGVVTPLSRVVGPGGAEIVGVKVPAGTVVGCSSLFVHMNPTIFPNPETFDPERWMQTDSTKLEPFLVSFSKGARGCIAVTLAWAELYLVVGNVLRRLDLELHNTTKETLRFRDNFGPLTAGHIKVKVVPVA